ncbi:MAG: TniB family NTP-binding protein [Actinobacteria bacterium]|nr:TniB family NTP-binding protein [Actinomycetota bacterium]
MANIVNGQHADDGPGLGIAMTGGPSFGKTATSVGFARLYERQIRDEFPAAFEQENEFIPVCYSSLVRGAGLKSQMEHILNFYGLPTARRATGTQLVDELIRVLNACRTGILCLDQAQNLHSGDKRDDQVAAALKEVMDGSHATLILVGIDIDSTGPLAIAAQGRLQASNDRLQLARRFTWLRMQKVDKDSQEWRDLLVSVENQLVLANAKQGDISVGLADEVWKRSKGAIGVAFNMLRSAANAAIADGSERITKRTLLKVPLTIEAAPTKKKAA